MKFIQQKRFIAIALAAVTVCGIVTVLLLSMRKAYAVTSLPHIEAIVSNMENAADTYDILEIVPQQGAGSIGYYIAGQEPTADWTSKLAAKPTEAERKAYADALMKNLTDSGLMGDKSDTPDQAPLTSAGEYQEVYPWERASTTQYTALPLANPEVINNVTGDMVEDTGNGDYTAQTENTLDNSGTQVQNIVRFELASATEEEVYYYNPTFVELTDETAPALTADTAIYTNTGTDTEPIYAYEGKADEGFDVSIKHYYVTQTGAPSATWDADHPYAAMVNSAQPFLTVEAGHGYFTTKVTGYTYQGDGQGSYRFTEGTSVLKITTNTIFYMGGYTNNNWFATKILDRGNDEIPALRGKIRVKSVTPDQVTAEEVTNADAIILSNGFYCNGTTVAGDSRDAISNFASETVANTVLDKTKQKQCAVILDCALASNGDASSINSVCKSLLADAGGDAVQGSFVHENVYVLGGTETGIPNVLATKELGTAFTPATVYTDTTGAFYAVYAEIVHENFLRQTADAATKDLMDTNVSMAQCIRYILNYAGQRSVVKLHSVRVLDIEPDSNPGVTESTVRSWYPSGVLTGTVEIVSMSTSEFIGKMEDVAENYDVVYIGDKTGSFSNFYAISGTSLCYTNIGDEKTIGSYKMSGVLDSDYYKSSAWFNDGKDGGYYYPLQSGSDTRTFRYSGNDLTAKKMQELVNFAAAGHSVILADALINDTSWYQDNCTLTAALNTQKDDSLADGLTATASLSGSISGTISGVEFSYQWYKDGVAMGGQNGQTNYLATANLEVGKSYYCVVSCTYHDKNFAATTEKVTVTATGTSVVSVNYSTATSGTITQDYRANVSYTVDSNGTVHLTTNLKNNRSTWYEDYYAFSSGNSLQVSTAGWADGEEHYYYCREYNSWKDITYSAGVPITKHGIKITAGSVDSTTKKDSTETIPAQARTKEVNTNFVDGASQMYQLINTIKDQANVQPASATKYTSDTTYEYLNLSHPQLQIAEKDNAKLQPPEYDENNKTDSKYEITELSYTFQIINTTDTTPVSTTYSLDLYLDTDANGYFADGESVGNLVCRDANGQEVDPSALYGNVSAELAPVYTVKRALPTDLVGYLSWKLAIVKNGEGNEHIHASQLGNTYVQGAAKAITILQVDAARDGYGAKGDNGGYNLENSTVYSGLLQESVVKSDFNAKIYTIYTDDLTKLYNMASDSNWAAEWKEYFWVRTYSTNLGYEDIACNDETTGVYNYLYGTGTVFNPDEAGKTPRERLSYLLKRFNMLILGFGDCYYGLGANDTALPVADYINAGMPVLMAHDTTSFYNVAFDGYPVLTYNGWGGNSYDTVAHDDYFWGYGANTVLRSLVSMDRYGVADATFGRSMYSDAYREMNQSGIAANSDAYEKLTDQQKQKLTAAGYSIAYDPITEAPNESNLQTILKTQGYSNYTLSEPGERPTTVSQVNKGQITSYPFNINTTAFGGNAGAGQGHTSDNEFNVALTHYQYYQLNMNKGDITVWYCLSGTGYQQNDVANGYYIYTVDNVTYTGAGHSSGYGDVARNDEAKLFVNTMIAAYRTQRTAPKMDLYSSDKSDSAMTTYALTTDYDGTGYAQGLVESSKDCPVYFAVNDTNLDGTRTNQITLSYKDPTTDSIVTVPAKDIDVRRADGVSGSSLNDTALSSGRRYVFYLPQSVLNFFGDETAISQLEIEIHISSIFTNRDGTTTAATDYQSTRKLSLFKMGLLDLS
jgi:hypothetical protein